MPIIHKVHVAGLTDLTEGMVKNEHITFAYFKSVTLDTLISRMSTYNRILPLDLNAMFNKKLVTFNAFNNDKILTPQTNYKRHEIPYKHLFKPSGIAHITLSRNPAGNWEEIDAEKELNWEHGLLVDQCHAGFKVNGTLQYFNWEELSLWSHTGKLEKLEIGL